MEYPVTQEKVLQNKNRKEAKKISTGKIIRISTKKGKYPKEESIKTLEIQPEKKPQKNTKPSKNAPKPKTLKPKPKNTSTEKPKRNPQPPG